MKTKSVVINKCWGGFRISDKAYELLIEWGVPVRRYIREKRGKDGLYKRVPENEGKVIFDRTLVPKEEDEYGFNDAKYIEFMGRYWETWLDDDRENPLLIKAIKKLGDDANGRYAKLMIVKIPADIDYVINEYDGMESIAEKHKSWG